MDHSSKRFAPFGMIKGENDGDQIDMLRAPFVLRKGWFPRERGNPEQFRQ